MEATCGHEVPLRGSRGYQGHQEAPRPPGESKGHQETVGALRGYQEAVKTTRSQKELVEDTRSHQEAGLSKTEHSTSCLVVLGPGIVFRVRLLPKTAELLQRFGGIMGKDTSANCKDNPVYTSSW